LQDTSALAGELCSNAMSGSIIAGDAFDLTARRKAKHRTSLLSRGHGAISVTQPVQSGWPSRFLVGVKLGNVTPEPSEDPERASGQSGGATADVVGFGGRTAPFAAF